MFLCVPTPQGDDGRADLSYIQAAATEIGPSLRPGAVVVNKSTVPVGSTRVVERAVRRDDVFVVSNPEFLREGTAVHDFLHPDRVVIGAADRDAAERVAALYAGLDAKILITDPASAETIKYAANGFLAMKISFVNAVAAMCEAVGADVAAVVARHRLRLAHRAGVPQSRSRLGWQLLPEGLPGARQDRRGPRLQLLDDARRHRRQRRATLDGWSTRSIRALEGHERSVLAAHASACSA